ncbi:SGS-domain-containing protein [Trichoderma citrinoviride]|uniref:SGS-domain-containing protein n=1 Tax=Trichoderma citrinoviride TaxID=58853 RepID=A0A2T4BJ81_9HYPO|nr:SGS-domain-containing protein [Trichoderma citrinoviride]PTB69348.1 SGS-domain-containing protein [Trichoderma citrinoviride]
MSYAAVAQQGLKAVEESDWNTAVEKLSEALRSSQNPAWLIARSKALAGLGRPEASLEDADLAWHMAVKRSRRELMASAQYRRGVAYFQLKQYANADYCLLHCMRLTKGGLAVPKEDPCLQYVDGNGFWTRSADDALRAAQQEEAGKKKLNDLGALSGSDDKDPLRAQMREWRMASTIAIQALKAMEKLPADDPARKLTTTLIPEQKDLVNHASGKASTGESASTNAAPAKVAAAAAAPPAVPKAADPNEPPFRMQDFQSDRNISVSIFSKGVDKEKLRVQFSETSVHLDPLVYSSGEQKEFHLDLWGEIDPSNSKYIVTPNKVELSLAKKTLGRWPAVQGDGAPKKAPLPKPEVAAASSEKPSAAKAVDAKPTVYPTSSKTGPKNWDAVGAEENSDDEKDVNAFFKKLYKGATPEQQRAMMKSFTESNGTSLSTNWDDVKDKTVATVPPDGVEAKKWD